MLKATAKVLLRLATLKKAITQKEQKRGLWIHQVPFKFFCQNLKKKENWKRTWPGLFSQCIETYLPRRWNLLPKWECRQYFHWSQSEKSARKCHKWRRGWRPGIERRENFFWVLQPNFFLGFFFFSQPQLYKSDFVKWDFVRNLKPLLCKKEVNGFCYIKFNRTLSFFFRDLI